MRTLLFLLQKEFRQIFRNKTLLASILVAPLVQLLILPLAANYEIKNIQLAVVDNDHSTYSQKLISKIFSSGYFLSSAYNGSYNDAYVTMEKGKADIILEIPPHFERNLIRENEQKVFIAADAVNGVKATIGTQYLGSIIADFNSEVRTAFGVKSLVTLNTAAVPTIEITSSNWFNPLMNYRIFMVPGILAILITMIGGYMCALNIVKEKEIGTIEQINVSPIRKYQFILGKLVPFWIIGMAVFSFGLLVIARLVYGIVPLGSIGVLYAFIAVYLLAVLGFGLLVSTYSDTQQQAMSVAFFFIMVFNLMSGLFTPIESMPAWAQALTRINPLRYFIEVMRMVVLKGSGFADVRSHFLIVLTMALILNVWAVWNYRKTS